MNFLYLTTFYPPYSFGEDGEYLHRIACALGDAGHRVDVAHCVDSYRLQHPRPPEIRFSDHPRVVRHELRSGWGLLSPLAAQQTGRAFLKRKLLQEIFNSRPYDVVHYHNISLLGPEVMALQPNRRLVIKMYTTHEHWLICPTQMLWKYGHRLCEKPDCLGCTLLSGRPPQWWRYTRLLERSAAHVDQFVAPSRFAANMHADRGFPYPVAHLPYFTERADDDWRNPAPRPQRAPYFLCAGRLEYVKGLQTLIETWRKVPGVDLLVAGTGTYEMKLRAMAASNPRIKFLGPAAQRELGSLYVHALACIVPSIAYETFGSVCIEAFARKTPVIARDLGALPEVIYDSGGGFVYRNEEGLLAAMHGIANSPVLRSELGEKGYRAFERWWSSEAHLGMYFEYLRECALRRFGYVPWEEGEEQRPTAVGY